MSTANDDLRTPTPPGPTIGRLLTSLILLAAAVDVFAPLIANSFSDDGTVLPATAAFFCCGLLAAQYALLGIWAVLGPQRLFVRWPLALLVGWFLYGVLLFGFAAVSLDGLQYAWEPALQIAALLPAMFVCVQIPLWGLKTITGGRIAHGSDERIPAAELRQFSLSQILTITTVLAFALGCMQFGFAMEVWPGPLRREEFAIFCGILGVGALFMVVPCVCIIFLARELRVGVIMGTIYSVVLAALAMILLRAQGGSDAAMTAGLLAFVLGLMGTQLGVLSLFRLRGYRLQTAFRKPSATQTAATITVDDETGSDVQDEE